MFDRRSFLIFSTLQSFFLTPSLCLPTNLKNKKKINSKTRNHKPIFFPKDHGAHFNHKIEWWYLTGYLDSDSGEQFAYQVTFFRNKTFIGDNNKSKFAPKHIIFAHATLISKSFGLLYFQQKSGRMGIGLIKCSDKDTNLQFEDWYLLRDMQGDFYRTKIRTDKFNIDLTSNAIKKNKSIILRGNEGLSRKGPDSSQYSWYYSRPNLKTNGVIGFNNKKYRVEGTSWLDHEWSNELLHPDAVGWDWIGINLLDGGSLMSFKIRRDNGTTLWSDFSMLDENGHEHYFLSDRNHENRKNHKTKMNWIVIRRWTSPNSFATYPISQRIIIGTLIMEVHPLFDDQEIDARASTGGFYWEGSVGVYVRQKLIGRGFLEMTGYSKPLKLS